MGKTDKNSVLEMEQLAASITEGTKNTLRDILSEAVSNYLREEVLNEDDDDTEDAEETTDVETSDVEEFDETSDDAENAEEAPEEADEAEEAEADSADADNAEDEGDEWADFDDYKIGDDEGSEEYDFTQETDPNKLVKVFKLMKNDDQVSVVKDGDKVSIKDNEEGTEYVIELDAEASNDNDELNDDFTMAESIGYTDNYQDKDPIEGLSMDGSAPKGTKDWHKGVPTGTNKPWAGKGKSDPFGNKTEKVFEITLNDEVELDETHTRSAIDRTTTISNARTSQPARNKRTAANGQVTTTTVSPTTESLQKKIDAALLENKQLKETVAKVSKIMKEAVQVNVNLGHIVRLMVENSTTKAEKEDIV